MRSGVAGKAGFGRTIVVVGMVVGLLAAGIIMWGHSGNNPTTHHFEFVYNKFYDLSSCSFYFILPSSGEPDGVSTYKSNNYESVDSVFADGEKVYVSVMDWAQTSGGRSTASAAYGGETISFNIYDDGTFPDPKAGDGIYWGVFTVGTGATDDLADYLHLPDGKEATITADVGNDGTPGTATILAYYINPVKVIVNPGDSIQDAINNLPAEGGIVELAPGVHEVADTIVINKSNVTIQGTHDSEVRFHGAPGKHLFEIPHLNTTPDEDWKNMPVLSNIRFKGFKTTNTYVGRSGSIVRAWNVRHITVEGILDESDNFYGGFAAIHATGGYTTAWGENIFIKNNEAKYKCTISTAFCKNAHIVGNIIPGSECVSCINVNRTQQFVYVRNNYAANAANHSIRLHSGNYIHCYGNICEGSQEGIYGDGVRPAIIENNIIRNVQPRYSTGAGIFINPQPTLKWTVRNNCIYNCRKGVYTKHYDYGFTGHKTHAAITNNVIYNCTEGGIIMDSPYVALDIRNNIIVNNGGYGIDYMETTELPTIIKYNDVWNNGNSASDNYNNTTPGIGDISVDPLFADPGNGDFHLKSEYGRWNGSAWVKDDVTSPCIDAGDPSSDYSNEPDYPGGRINMGAYGNTAEASLGEGVDVTPPEITLKTFTINGSVGDDTVTEVQINGVSVPVSAGKYSYEVDVSAVSTITITATNSKGETVTRVIEIK